MLKNHWNTLRMCLFGKKFVFMEKAFVEHKKENFSEMYTFSSQNTISVEDTQGTTAAPNWYWSIFSKNSQLGPRQGIFGSWIFCKDFSGKQKNSGIPLGHRGQRNGISERGDSIKSNGVF